MSVEREGHVVSTCWKAMLASSPGGCVLDSAVDMDESSPNLPVFDFPFIVRRDASCPVTTVMIYSLVVKHVR